MRFSDLKFTEPVPRILWSERDHEKISESLSHVTISLMSYGKYVAKIIRIDSNYWLVAWEGDYQRSCKISKDMYLRILKIIGFLDVSYTKVEIKEERYIEEIIFNDQITVGDLDYGDRAMKASSR